MHIKPLATMKHALKGHKQLPSLDDLTIAAIYDYYKQRKIKTKGQKIQPEVRVDTFAQLGKIAEWLNIIRSRKRKKQSTIRTSASESGS